uniref:Secreted protein n=1 Tax=Angiostrongylus cantonensis TaxID=6313 RepID=A0A0K0CTR7_ANGCA
MRVLEFCLVISMTVVLSYGDCGCGSKCANYTGPAKCTRCCTATVKRSLDSFPRRANRFLLPTSDDQIRKLKLKSRHQQQAYPKHRYHRLPTMSLLEQILAQSINSDI